jgi:SAM-dependent methyltransferase
LELGSGGGNNASHLKAYFEMTLVDLSPEMLEVSGTLNPDCEHVLGDMRSVRLGRQFDAIFIQDAISYMTSESDLRQAIQTAYTHCKPGCFALFHPDYVRETFREASSIGGHSGSDRALRYIEWTWDPDPEDCTYRMDFAYLLRDPEGAVRCEPDEHLCGLFDRPVWLHLIEACGFQAAVVPFTHSEIPPGSSEVFLGQKPAG